MGRKQDCVSSDKQDSTHYSAQFYQLQNFFKWVVERFANIDSEDPCRRRYEMDREANEDVGGIHVDVVLYKGIPIVRNPAAFEELHKGNCVTNVLFSSSYI